MLASLASRSFNAVLGDYFCLMKPRLMSLSVFTAVVGMALAPGSLGPWKSFSAILAIALGAGAAGVLNMWYDRDIDALMPRTQKRALPSGRITPDNALVFGILCAVTGVMVLGWITNALAAGLLALTIGFYFLIYTIWLKRRTAQNIIIGGACGALPPVIGWACVTGDISAAPCLLFMIIFLWQAPHFWALSLFRVNDYAVAQVPMLPVVAGARATKQQILVYTLLMDVSVFAPLQLGMLSWIYGGAALLLTIYFNHCAWQVWRSDNPQAPKKLFFFSIFYLLCLFSAMLIDKAILGEARLW